MAHSSFNVGLLKYNLLMVVMVGTYMVEHTLSLKMLNVQFCGMQKNFWTFTMELDTIFALHQLAISKQGYKVGIWTVLLGIDAKVFHVSQLDLLIFW